MHSAMSVDICVTIREACPVAFIVSGQHIEFSYGSLQKGFHFSFEPGALRKLLMLGAEALAELVQAERELDETDEDLAVPELRADAKARELATAGERSA